MAVNQLTKNAIRDALSDIDGAERYTNPAQELKPLSGGYSDAAQERVEQQAEERAREHSDDLKNKDVRELTGQSGGTTSGGAMRGGTAYTAATTNAQLAQQEKAERDDKFIKLVLMLEARITALQAEIDAMDRDIGRFDGLMDDIRAGKNVTDENGELLDKDLEARVKAYEDKYGVKVDRTDPDAIQAVQDDLIKTRDEYQQDMDRMQSLANDFNENHRNPNFIEQVRSELETEDGVNVVRRATFELEEEEAVQQVVAAYEVNTETAQSIEETIKTKAIDKEEIDSTDTFSQSESFLLDDINIRETSISKNINPQQGMLTAKNEFNESSFAENNTDANENTLEIDGVKTNQTLDLGSLV